MVAEAKEVGKNRTRESYGRYLEDFKVGDVYEHRPGRTITESDNTHRFEKFDPPTTAA